MEKEQKFLFEKEKISKAIIKLALPSIAGQIILVIYNMADTFFVGLTHSDSMIAAVTVCLPAFMFLSAISNLFGIGGGAAYARALGKKHDKRCDNIAAHALYGCLLVTGIYSFLAFLFRDFFITVLGGSHPEVHRIAVQYLLVTVVFGGLTTACSTLFSHLIRSEGRSASASAGIIMGGILNIILDPLFMFVLLPKGNEVLGAAIATALSNLIACVYFWILITKNKLFRFRYNENAFADGSAREIIMTGLPACLMTLFENISYAVLDGLMAFYGIAAQAGVGVAKKINMLAHSIVRGMAQGVLPLLAYSYSSHRSNRLKQTIRISSLSAGIVSLLLTVLNLTCGKIFVGMFVEAGSWSFSYGVLFLKILCIGCPFSGIAYTIISFFQAVNESAKSFLLAIFRKGALDIPMMYLLNAFIGMAGIVASTPLADIACCVVAVLLTGRWFKAYDLKMMQRQAA